MACLTSGREFVRGDLSRPTSEPHVTGQRGAVPPGAHGPVVFFCQTGVLESVEVLLLAPVALLLHWGASLRFGGFCHALVSVRHPRGVVVLRYYLSRWLFMVRRSTSSSRGGIHFRQCVLVIALNVVSAPVPSG